MNIEKHCLYSVVTELLTGDLAWQRGGGGGCLKREMLIFGISYRWSEIKHCFKKLVERWRCRGLVSFAVWVPEIYKSQFPVQAVVKTQDLFKLALNVKRNVLYQKLSFPIDKYFKCSLELAKSTEQYLLRAFFSINTDSLDP